MDCSKVMLIKVSRIQISKSLMLKQRTTPKTNQASNQR